jgi:hypothetical protein
MAKTMVSQCALAIAQGSTLAETFAAGARCALAASQIVAEACFCCASRVDAAPSNDEVEVRGMKIHGKHVNTRRPATISQHTNWLTFKLSNLCFG